MKQPSNKSYIVAVSLCMIFGVMGVHHFYLGRIWEGIIDLLLFIATIYFYFTGQIGLAALFFLIDSAHTVVVTIMLLVGAVKDGEGKTVCYPGQKLN